MPRILPLGLALLLATQAAAQSPPIVLLEPAGNQQLTGTIQVRVKADAAQIVVAGVGGAPSTELTKTDAGEWTGGLDTTLVPNGSQKLIVLTENKKVGPSADVAVENPLKIWFADLHSHTSYSDGALVPVVAHRYARDVAKLDVFCLTDHLEAVSDQEWLDMREVAFDANEDGSREPEPKS